VKIAVNLAAVRSVGTEGYALGFVPALAEEAAGDRVLVLSPPRLAETLRRRLPPHAELRVVGGRSVAARLAWEQTLLPLLLRRWGAQVLLAPMELAPLLSPCPVVLAVHNPSPHLAGGLAHWLRRVLTGLSARAAKRVIFVSRSAAAFLGPRLRVPADKQAVIPHGTDPARWSSPDDGRPGLDGHGLAGLPYVLYVSQLYRYKDPETLIDAFGIWQADSAQPRHRLALTGEAVERGFREELAARVRQRGLGDQVRFLGLVPEEALPALYRNATVFALPTRVETFGRPFIEAMAAGTPVVCADIDVAREVCADAALYFPPGDAHALAERLRGLATDAALRAEMAARGRERAGTFTWQREARETLALLRAAAAP
jgi:glycosyltransferase involved in cell wall biosynthesis